MLKYPITAFWEISDSCNLRCLHCYTNSGPEKSVSLSKDQAFKLIDNMADKQIYSLGIGGGEPLMLLYLDELIEHITKRGMKISLSTNGTLIDDNRAKKFNELGLGAAQISIDGLRDTHDYIRGKGNFDRAISGIKHLIAHGISVRVAFTVNKKNYHDMYEVTKLAKSLGTDSVVFFRYMPCSVRGEELKLDKETLYHAAQNILKAKELQENKGYSKFLIYYERVSFLSFLLNPKDLEQTKCLGGEGMCNITSEGNITICPHLSKVVGNIWHEELGYIWKKMNQETLKLHDIPSECKECEFASICRGGCKGISYLSSGSFNAKDECCYKDLVL
jgi:radical SAM protein with 4Fe4S-binding SPASM domain